MLFIILLNLLTIGHLHAKLVGGILLPHGDFAYDPSFFRPNTRERAAANRIATAARKAGKWLVDVNPDIIFLSTPHGIKLDNNFGIYMNDKGFGSATIGGDLIGNSTYKKAYNVSKDIDMDLQLSQDLLATLHDKNVSAIYSFSESIPMILNWGEIIPLLLLPEGGHKSYKHIIWSQPERRYNHATEMVPELLQVGQAVVKWIESRPERIGVIISGDLSHTHLPDGPYGYSNASSIFDKDVGKWASAPYSNEKTLLEAAKQLQPRAMSCGFTGYIMWHGMLTAIHMPKSVVYADLNVTYYGMMAASFGAALEIFQDPDIMVK